MEELGVSKKENLEESNIESYQHAVSEINNKKLTIGANKMGV
jgi:hypothetical protein